MQTVSSASWTASESRSATEWATTVWTPSSWQARMMRTAISPRFAIRTLLNIAPRADGRPSGHHDAAVDVEHLAGHVAGGIRGQECDRLGDVLRAAGRAERDDPEHGLLGLVARRGPDVGLD